MKAIFWIIVDFVKSDFKVKTYSLVAVFLFVTIYFNYNLNWEKGSFEDTIIDGARRGITQHICYFLFYGFAYYGTVIIISFSTKNWDVYIPKHFGLPLFLVWG